MPAHQDRHAGRPGPVDELAAGRQEPVAGGRDVRGGLALGTVLGAAVAWNLAANLWLPWALYVPGALLLAATLVAVAAKLGGCRWSDLGLDRHDLRRGLTYGVVVAVPVTVVFALGAALPATRVLFQDRRAAGISTAVLLYVAFVRVPLGTVVLEEILFRGVLLGLGLRRWSHMTAVTVSCAAFGLWHVLPARRVTSFTPVLAGLAGGQVGRLSGVVAAVAGTVVAGLVLCWLRLRSRSLLAPALCMPPSTGWAMGSPSSPGALPDRHIRRHQLRAEEGWGRHETGRAPLPRCSPGIDGERQLRDARAEGCARQQPNGPEESITGWTSPGLTKRQVDRGARLQPVRIRPRVSAGLRVRSPGPGSLLISEHRRARWPRNPPSLPRSTRLTSSRSATRNCSV